MLADNVCSGADALNKHRAARMLVDVRGRVEAMMVLRDKGISALITCLDGILPPLVAAGELLYRSSFPQPHTICILLTANQLCIPGLSSLLPDVG